MPLYPMVVNGCPEPAPNHLWRNRDPNWDHQFGMGLTVEEIYMLATNPELRLPRRIAALHFGDSRASVIGKDGLQVSMDVHQFQPNELSVRAIGHCIVVKGKHGDREDEHGKISRNFERTYTLPKEYKIRDVVTTLTSDGILTIKAPPPQLAIEEGKEHNIHIQQTGPAHLNVQDKPEEKPEDKPEEKPEDKPEEKPEDNPEDKPEDITEDNPEDISEDNPEDSKTMES